MSMPIPAHEPALLAPEAESLPPARTGRVLGRIFGLTVAGALAGAAAGSVWPASYVATSEMLIASGDPMQGSGSRPADIAAGLMESQMHVLRSGTMLAAVADRLNLAADAEFNGIGGALSALGDIVTGGDGVEERRRRAIETLARSVDVRRQGTSSSVAVSAATGDAGKSALIANTLAEIFVESGGRNPGTVAGRLAELRDAVARADAAVAAFRLENGLADAEGALITDREIARLGEQLSSAQARTVELNALAAAIRDANVDSIVTGSLPEQHSGPALAELRARHAAARQEVERLSARLGPRHPERLDAEAVLAGTRQEVAVELRRTASSLQSELKRAVEQEQELAGQLARMKARQGDMGTEMARLRELESDARLKQSAYERALQDGAGAVGAGSIISRAEPPLQASGPSTSAFSLAGAFAGLFAGLGLAGWRRQLTGAEPAAPCRDNMLAEEGFAPDDAALNEIGKEADAMYPYSPYDHSPTPQPGPAMQYEPAQQHASASLHPQPMAPMPQPAMAHPAWPGSPYPAQPMPAAHWPAHQPMMPAQYDPWAQYRQPAPPPLYPTHGYAPQPQAVVYYVPVPQPAVALQPPVQPAPRPALRPRVVEDRWEDQDAFIDRNASAAIEEIRQSLRDFRAAVEDFADERHRRPDRRFGG